MLRPALSTVLLLTASLPGAEAQPGPIAITPPRLSARAAPGRNDKPRQIKQPMARFALNGQRIDGNYLAIRAERLGRADISDIDMRGSGFLLRAAGGAGAYRVERVRSVDAVYSPTYGMGLIRLGNGDYSGSVFRDLYWRGGAPGQADRDPRAVIQLAGKDPDDRAQGILIERFDFADGFITGARFDNFDGIAFERNYRDVTIRDGRLDGFSDACIDSKGIGAVIERVSGSRCSYLAKVWSSARFADIDSRRQRIAHFRLVGRPEETVTARFAGTLRVDASVPLFFCDTRRGPVEAQIDVLEAPRNLVMKRGDDCRITVRQRRYTD